MRLLTPRTGVSGLVGGAALSSGVALTATSGWLIVRASERPVILTLMTAIVAVRTFGMARPVLRHTERLLSHDAALDKLATERTGLYAALVPLTPARLARRGRAAMLTGVVDDLTDRVEAQVRVGVPFVATALTGLLTALLCWVVEPLAGAVLLGLLGVVAGTTAFAWWVEERGQDRLAGARAEAARVAELVSSQALELQAVGGTAAARQWLDTAHAELTQAVRRLSLGRATAAAVLPLATASATVACALVALASSRPTPVLALLVLAPFALAEVFAPLPDASRALAAARAADCRIASLLDATPAVAAATAPATDDQSPRPTGPRDEPVLVAAPHLRLAGVSASWDGRRPAAHQVDLNLPPGSLLALTGPSGCGKSTVLAVLARHLDPAGGRYTVDGRDVLDLPLVGVRALFALVDDEPHVFASTLRANLLLARPEASDAEARDALCCAGLGAWLAGLPDGLDTVLGTGGRGLSGGERARLSIARALLSRRPVLLLDEPVAHLDNPTAVAVMDDLLRARGRRTVVVVSHRPEGLAGADGIMDLSDRAPAAARG